MGDPAFASSSSCVHATGTRALFGRCRTVIEVAFIFVLPAYSRGSSCDLDFNKCLLLLVELRASVASVFEY